MGEQGGQEWDADADDGADIVLLVNQGLLPLPMRSILTARLVCKQWRHNIGCLLDHITLPFEVWSGSNDTSITSPQAHLQRSQQLCASSPKGKEAADADPSEPEEAEDALAAAVDADDVWVPPCAFQVRGSKRQHPGALACPKLKQQRKLHQEGPGVLEYEPDTEQLQAQPQQLQQLKNMQSSSSVAEQQPQLQKQQQRKEHGEQDEGDEQMYCNVHHSVREEQQQGQQCDSVHDKHNEPAPSDQPFSSSIDAAGSSTCATAAALRPPATENAADVRTSAAAAGTPAAAVVATGVRAPSLAAAAAAGTRGLNGAVVSSGGQDANRTTARHPLHQLPTSFPCAGHVTLQCRYRSSSASERATPSFSKLATSLLILGQLPKLHTLVLQGSLPRLMWQPLMAGLLQQQQPGDHTHALSNGQERITDAMQVDQQLQLQPRVLNGLQKRLVCLKLVGCDLPTAEVIEGLVGLRALRELVLHASIKSPALQPDHLEALSTGTQLESLSLIIYQIGLGGSSRVQLNPLLQLTNLRSLDVAYKGIFNDQRPHFRSQGHVTALQHLTNLSTSGLASPVIPQPSLTALVSFSAVGNNRRLGGGSLATLSSCSSIKSLKIEAGKRGVAAVAAEHLHFIGTMTQLTSITLSLSKGSQAASKSTQQLLQLQIPGLKALSVGSGDHRIGIRTEQFQELAAQWPRLESLRLTGFSPLQGLAGIALSPMGLLMCHTAPPHFLEGAHLRVRFECHPNRTVAQSLISTASAGLGAFISLQALSLKPGTGTGKLLLELQAALEPLQQLKRLHLDFKSALQLEHVEAIAIACADRLQHLSLDMRAVGIGSKAVEYIAQLTCLTSLQLLGTRVGTFAGPPAAVALQSMQGLRWMSVQAVEDTLAQAPAALGRGLWNGLQTLTQLRELRVWLGSGVEGRHAQETLVQKVEAKLHNCTCYALHEPEKPVM